MYFLYKQYNRLGFVTPVLKRALALFPRFSTRTPRISRFRPRKTANCVWSTPDGTTRTLGHTASRRAKGRGVSTPPGLPDSAVTRNGPPPVTGNAPPWDPPPTPLGNPQHGANFSPVIPSKLHPCHLERGGATPHALCGGSGCSYLGGRMHPLSNHDMAKLVRATGLAGRAAPHPGGSGAP